MISAWHLAWVIPVCIMTGIFIMGLMVAAGNADVRMDDQFVDEEDFEDD